MEEPSSSMRSGKFPVELQPKLLRVLQDQEFERLGSNHTRKVNVRLIAATNRNLADSIARHQFRSDLFYRLSVFPISCACVTGARGRYSAPDPLFRPEICSSA